MGTAATAVSAASLKLSAPAAPSRPIASVNGWGELDDDEDELMDDGGAAISQASRSAVAASQRPAASAARPATERDRLASFGATAAKAADGWESDALDALLISDSAVRPWRT